MGFSLKYALAGAARRGSEIIEETRKDAFSFMDQQLNSWNEDAKEEKDKHEKKTLRMKNNMKFLKTRKFTDDQIGAALFEEDGGDAIVKHIQELEEAGQTVPVADIISFAPGYEASGISASQWLENAVGKIKAGKPVDEAVDGGLSGMFMQSRVKSFEALTGQDASQMRGYARGEYEYGERPSGAKVTLLDPYKKAQVDKALKGTGQFSVSEFRQFETAAGFALNISLGYDTEGNRIFPAGKEDLAEIAQNSAALAQEEYIRLQTPEGGGLTEAAALTKAIQFAKDKAKALQDAGKPPPPPPGSEQVIDFSGMGIQEISDATRSQVEGLDPVEDVEKIRKVLGQAMAALVAAGEAANITNPYEEAAREIELIRKSITN
jgi:hypothetical protein